ncbi:carbohydrate ABC transporter permease [Streptomyces indicus]|uniref:Multiple sugar transport system permease protein n=1 Tax=Streptomyces indicus TaxID=417292 RepID=A0A1G8URI4_9ACTN|nr:sugar ABC transporter permease [Streptomyces indicus]SDJ56167.1 multiple sugar transport system permease protein [Streptomyces indicus]
MGANTAVAPPHKSNGIRTGEAAGPEKPRRPRDDRKAAWLFLAPVLVGFALFYAYPTLRGVYYSLTDYNMLAPPNFTGAENYQQLIGDEQFWNALRVTGYYVVLNIGSQILLALILATLMHRLTRSVALRALLLVPWLVPNVTVGLVWLWLLDANLGFVNHMLDALGMETTSFFNSPSLAMPTVALVNTWAYTGYTALLLYAGMLQVPQHLYESASLDGAGEWRMFSRITLPLLRPVLALVLVVSLIGSFQIFDTIAVTTKGGPVSATRVIYYYIYEQAFTQFHMGYASAIAVVLALLLGVLTAVQMRLLRASRSDLA